MHFVTFDAFCKKVLATTCFCVPLAGCSKSGMDNEAVANRSLMCHALADSALLGRPGDRGLIVHEWDKSRGSRVSTYMNNGPNPLSYSIDSNNRIVASSAYPLEYSTDRRNALAAAIDRSLAEGAISLPVSFTISNPNGQVMIVLQWQDRHLGIRVDKSTLAVKLVGGK